MLPLLSAAGAWAAIDFETEIRPLFQDRVSNATGPKEG
ncbi:hypothetical protein EMGBD4_15410 [Verrucomicrobiota bacterium]|nr:hypothetical protein EMGBD4_15410 [Verrucomicrobiota bacterium]